jgi:phosphoenolpyruvate synthase/pyruvate phosphate dikinase
VKTGRCCRPGPRSAGSTGAGLNLTVPNVVGFENVLQALNRVWASPFTARAFAWRQAHMEQPEHVYPAVLLLRSVPSEKSGVLVTQDIDTGDPRWLSAAVNEGVGGAVDGQAAETLRVSLDAGQVRLLASATAPMRRVLSPQGGVEPLPASGRETVLTEAEIAQLIRLAQELPSRFPAITDAAGRPTPADMEFGFVDGKLRLFQIRPFLESARARSSVLLNAMDQARSGHAGETVPLDAVP